MSAPEPEVAIPSQEENEARVSAALSGEDRTVGAVNKSVELQSDASMSSFDGDPGAMVGSPSAGTTMARFPLRVFLRAFTTDPEQSGRMARKMLGTFGSEAKVKVYHDGRIWIVSEDGKRIEPLDPEWFGADPGGWAAEGVTDLAEDTVRGTPASVGALAGGVAGAALTRSPAGIQGGRVAGAAIGEGVRQLGEEAATRTILGEPSAMNTQDRLTEAALASQ